MTEGGDARDPDGGDARAGAQAGTQAGALPRRPRPGPGRAGRDLVPPPPPPPDGPPVPPWVSDAAAAPQVGSVNGHDDGHGPRPRPRPAGAPAQDTYRAPDLSRFLAASEADEEPRGRRLGRSRRAGRAGQQDTATKDDDGDGSSGGRGRSLRGLVRLGVVVLIAVLAAVLLRVFVVQPYYIPSESMEPTLHGCTGCNDDRILVDKLSYRSSQPRTQDIVVFHRPPGDSATESVLIKRVVGQGGDTVTLRNGLVYVNGLALNEPYVNPKCGPRPNRPLTGRTQWKVPQNDVFVMGDNRCDSHDSRAFGPIPDSSVIGRAFFIYWPIGRVGTL